MNELYKSLFQFENPGVGLASYFNSETAETQGFPVDASTGPNPVFFSEPGLDLANRKPFHEALSLKAPGEIQSDLSSVYSGAVVNQIDPSMFMVPAPSDQPVLQQNPEQVQFYLHDSDRQEYTFWQNNFTPLSVCPFTRFY